MQKLEVCEVSRVHIRTTSSYSKDHSVGGAGKHDKEKRIPVGYSCRDSGVLLSPLHTLHNNAFFSTAREHGPCSGTCPYYPCSRPVFTCLQCAGLQAQVLIQNGFAYRNAVALYSVLRSRVVNTADSDHRRIDLCKRGTRDESCRSNTVFQL